MSSEVIAEAMGQSGGDVAIRVGNVSKRYVMFSRPEDRFKQMVVPRLERLVGRPPRRYFKDFAALDGVSFEVGRGETVGIIGRNGSGKSTLLQIICGTLQPTTGAVEVNGRIAALLELGAGFNPEFTGRENVFLNASILGVPRKEMEWRFDDIARFADIGDFIDQPVKTYSSGMYVRLAFAVAINVDPDILIVDEALSVGDEAFQRKCFARIEDIRDRGGTILFVSHGAQTIVQLCNRAILMDRGEKILEGRPKIVVNQYQRLLNLSGADAEAVRNELKVMDGWGGIDAEDAAFHEDASSGVEKLAEPLEDVKSPLKVYGAELISYDDANDGISDYFDSGLASQSVVSFEENGARIRDFEIRNSDDALVNVLRLRRRYTCSYIVEIIDRGEDVGFGVWISNIEGLGIGGIQTGLSRDLKLKRVNPGERYRVSFSFLCLMLPRTYFCTADVWGADGRVMHKVVDISAFRVAPTVGPELTGRIDLLASLDVMNLDRV